MHERLGHRAVQSYIQSGNVVFSATKAAATTTAKLATEFGKEFGFAAKVVVVEAKRWGDIVAKNPYVKFAADDPKKVSVGICEGEPDAKGLKALLAKTGGSESFVVGKGVVYLHAGRVRNLEIRGRNGESVRRSHDGAQLANGRGALGNGERGDVSSA